MNMNEEKFLATINWNMPLDEIGQEICDKFNLDLGHEYGQLINLIETDSESLCDFIESHRS